MEYTKGEWKSRMGADGSRIIYVETESGDEIICRDIRHFNVPVVTAAPSMYEALKLARASMGMPLLTRQAVDKALSKAEGK